MKIKFILLFVITLFQKSYTQEIKLRNLEREAKVEINLNDNHIIKGNPSKVVYKNYTYDAQLEEYKETLSTFLNLYRTSTFNFDSIGRVKNRLLFKYGNIKGIDEYHYQDKNNGQKVLFVQRYWWDNSNKKELYFSLKEIYDSYLLRHRFTAQFELEFIYDNKNNLIEIVKKEYQNIHLFNQKGEILNLKNNKIIKSQTLCSFNYDENNNRIEKKEIINEYMTYISRYIYNEKGKLIKNIKLSYTEGILSYVNPQVYKYDKQENIIELNEYIKHTVHESPSGTDEEYIQSFLSYIDENPESYLVEHNAYTYEYDEKGNWISKTFYKNDTSYEYKNKLIRQIDYK